MDTMICLGGLGRQSKLSIEKAIEIRNSQLSNKELAEKYNVTPTCIQFVRNYRTWN